MTEIANYPLVSILPSHASSLTVNTIKTHCVRVGPRDSSMVRNTTLLCYCTGNPGHEVPVSLLIKSSHGFNLAREGQGQLR